MRYYIETYGCAANRADEVIMKEVLNKRGWVEDTIDRCDVIIINTCGVKKPTEDKILWRIRELSSLNKPVVIAGCLPRINLKRLRELRWNVAIDSNSVHRIDEACMYALNNSYHKIIFSERPPSKPSLTLKPLTEAIGVIEIQEGCTFECSFCATRFSRGRAISYPIHDIIKALESQVRNGAWEIWFTGQDVAVYDYGGIRLPDLLFLASEVEGDFMIRVGMMTPVYAARIEKKLIEAYKKISKAFKFVHLPVQSGSDKVLSLMRRGHKVDLFYRLVDSFRREIKWVTLATDIIVGHPGEEEEDFEETVKLIEKVKPEVVNLSKFGFRPGTHASRMKQIPTDIIAKRSRYLYGLILKIMEERNERWINWEGEAVVTQRGTKKGTWIARNFAYRPIVVKSEENILKRKLLVRIDGIAPTHLFGEVVRVLEA